VEVVDGVHVVVVVQTATEPIWTRVEFGVNVHVGVPVPVTVVVAPPTREIAITPFASV
jgi:hypothetical protein